MNKDHRKEIDRIISEINDKLTPLVDEIREAIEAVRDEEQDYYDNMPESLQGGEKGDTAQEAISQLEEALTEIEAIDFNAVADYLASAQG